MKKTVKHFERGLFFIDWSINTDSKPNGKREIGINGIKYIVSPDTACLSHCLGLLLDAIIQNSKAG